MSSIRAANKAFALAGGELGKGGVGEAEKPRFGKRLPECIEHLGEVRGRHAPLSGALPKQEKLAIKRGFETCALRGTKPVVQQVSA